MRLGLAESGAEGPEAQWVYALAAPFPTVEDEVSAAAFSEVIVASRQVAEAT